MYECGHDEEGAVSQPAQIGTLQLSGWKVGVALAVLITLTTVRVFSSKKVTDVRLLEALQTELFLESARSGLTELASALDREDDDTATQLAGKLAESNVEFVEVAGSAAVIPIIGAKEFVVRVTYRLEGSSPVRRYYRVEKRSLGSWWIGREVSALSFYLDLV